MFQYAKVIDAFKAANQNFLTKQEVMGLLEIEEASVCPYIFYLKNKFKCDFVAQKNGKQIVGWTLSNPDTVVLEKVTPKAKVVKQKVAAPVKDKTSSAVLLETDHLESSYDRELADIRSQLGV